MSKKISATKKITYLFVLGLICFPAIASALTLGEVFINITSTILNPLVGLFLTAAVVIFFWGMVKYIYSLGEKEKTEGRSLMIWGVIALFVMVSVWGLVKAVGLTFGITDNTPVQGVVIPPSSGSNETRLVPGSFIIE